jgi:hypothetical protein
LYLPHPYRVLIFSLASPIHIKIWAM